MNRERFLVHALVLYVFRQMFLSDLLTYAKEQARIEAIDYFDPDPRLRTAHEVSAWQHDKYCRDNSRRYLFKKFPARLKNANKEELIPGTYGRLTIAETDIDYCVGQYAPLEIYGAVFSYLHQTNAN